MENKRLNLMENVLRTILEESPLFIPRHLKENASLTIIKRPTPNESRTLGSKQQIWSRLIADCTDNGHEKN